MLIISICLSFCNNTITVEISASPMARPTASQPNRREAWKTKIGKEYHMNEPWIIITILLLIMIITYIQIVTNKQGSLENKDGDPCYSHRYYPYRHQHSPYCCYHYYYYC